jgi:hypothetical protein
MILPCIPQFSSNSEKPYVKSVTNNETSSLSFRRSCEKTTLSGRGHIFRRANRYIDQWPFQKEQWITEFPR